MSLKDLNLRLASIAAVKAHLSGLERDTKAELMDEVGGRMGATAAVLPDGTEAATVSIAKGKAAAWKVVDDRAFLAWVKENRPTAVVEAVRSSDQDSILGAIEKMGEIPDGVALGDAGEPYVMVRQSAEQRDAVVAAWRSGELALPSMKEIES